MPTCFDTKQQVDGVALVDIANDPELQELIDLRDAADSVACVRVLCTNSAQATELQLFLLKLVSELGLDSVGTVSPKTSPPQPDGKVPMFICWNKNPGTSDLYEVMMAAVVMSFFVENNYDVTLKWIAPAESKSGVGTEVTSVAKVLNLMTYVENCWERVMLEERADVDTWKKQLADVALHLNWDVQAQATTNPLCHLLGGIAALHP
eukprot:TRINITY_DN2704_c0_g1_i1.p1 TRINITY_DN2704_c0_g1~~TRINITY_DN2704_c0_g1_i1.p1  ORF type:complete len:207 (+),score=25.28 TRINITY_DN2704_c0_g1_i1:22-642(+)